MATFPDDFVRLHTVIMGTINVPMGAIGLEWPPPEFIVLGEGGTARAAADDDPPEAIMRRVRMSEITDEQRRNWSRVARGAEYTYVRKPRP